MKFWDHNGEALIEITVDIDKLDKFSQVSDFESTGPGYKRPQFYTTEVNIGLSFKDRNLFRSRLKELLNSKETGKNRFDFDYVLDQQFDELLFMRLFLKGYRPLNYKPKEKHSSEIKFRQIVAAMGFIREISERDELKMFVIKERSDRPITPLILPKAVNTKLLFTYISDAIKQYFLDNEREIVLEMLLLPYKNQPINLDVYESRIKDLDKLPKATEDSLIGMYAEVLLSYIKFLPQFPSSLRKNTIMSEAQANFIIDYLQIFGFHNQSFQINLKYQEPFTTPKELRRTVERFRKQFINR